MRLLHTSDWHLGRPLHGFSLLDHQAVVLEALVDAVRTESIDAVVVAGDVYDRSVPPLEAVALFSDTLARLRAAGATVVVISGNHDSATRLGFGREVLAAGGVHVATDIARAGTPVMIVGRTGAPVAIYPIPYLEPEAARHALAKPDARSHDALLRAALARCRCDLATRGDVRSIAVAHAFVAGGAACSSEKALVVGGSAEVGVGAFRGFDYVALGHLHGRQTFGDGRVRYSGSPLAYSFDEASHIKGAWIVDLAADGVRS
ncbi:MAG TPA: exonuclease subunit SbcD, partial [Acidimicrobiales bacterium]|nr:exonuclease subunit SbcD [Acidimicrobiales bacterium]